MTRSDLYQALEELNREKMEEISKMEAEAEEHTFSEEFELKMDRLIRKWRRKYVKATNYRLRKSWVAAAVVALILSATMSVEASRAAITRFVIEMYEKYSNIGYEENDVKYAPDEILEYREPVWGTEYAEVNRVETPYFLKVTQKNSLQEEIFYSQNVLKYEEGVLNTEYSQLNKETLKNGLDIYFITYEEYSILFWNDGEYYYSLKGKIDKEEMINLVLSMHPNK